MTGQFIPPSDEEISQNEDNIYCNEDERTYRLDICKSCEKFSTLQEHTKCLDCGCSISLLIVHKFKSCPLEKW
jgi:hypothetical protein